ncbi:hypothetical protein [Metabacillus sp. 84]|uniref:hypothetical protein n=1 Tax=unclassified Metabacillus TaxID=2675274 RepID=UPI003CE8E7A5
MSEKTLNEGQNYTARSLETYLSENDAVLVSSNNSSLFKDPDREYKVVKEMEGFFEHKENEGSSGFTEKRTYYVEKV